MDEFEENWEEAAFFCPEYGDVRSYKLVNGKNGVFPFLH
jgi:hypothetical protein